LIVYNVTAVRQMPTHVEHDMALWELQLYYIVRVLLPVQSTNSQYEISVQMHHCNRSNWSVLPTTVNSMATDADNLNRCQSN